MFKQRQGLKGGDILSDPSVADPGPIDPLRPSLEPRLLVVFEWNAKRLDNRDSMQDVSSISSRLVPVF